MRVISVMETSQVCFLCGLFAENVVNEKKFVNLAPFVISRSFYLVGLMQLSA
jgi:hypothetical protein